MRWSKQILRKLPSGPKVMSLMVSSWLSQFKPPPLKVKISDSLFAFVSARGCMRLIPGSPHSTAFCLAFHQGNKPLRDTPVCIGQLTLLKAGCSPLSQSKLVFRQLTYNLAFCEPSSLRREGFRKMNKHRQRVLLFKNLFML